MANSPKYYLRILPALFAVGVMAGSTNVMAAPADSSSSRLDKMISRLMPADGGSSASRKLAKRLVLAADGIGQQNIVVDENHSIALGKLFDSGKLFLSERGKTLLDDLGNALSSTRLLDATYLIGGHTDASGNDNKNRELSEQRAGIVKKYLVDNFDIDPARLAVAGFGEERLADPEQPNSDINRRVEVSLVTSGYTTARKRAKRSRPTRVSHDRHQPATDGNNRQPSYEDRHTAANDTSAPHAPYAALANSHAAVADSDFEDQAYNGGYDQRYDQSPVMRAEAPAARRAAPAYKAMPQGYSSELDDYGSVMALPPTMDRTYGGNTGNAVCDSAPGSLYDPRPMNLDMDDYGARTPTTCPSYSMQALSKVDYSHSLFQDGDDEELLK